MGNVERWPWCMRLGLAPLFAIAVAAGSYKNVTISADGLSATVFLPPASPEERGYYIGTRFDWSTQIGNVLVGPHVVFGHEFWGATATDPWDPEAGVGLAEEFGCGASGALCAAGPLHHKAGSENGVLGFEEARAGDAFLKIGVGKLLKPSSTGPWNLTHRYDFAEWPRWEVNVSADSVTMAQEVSLNSHWCYRKYTSAQIVDSYRLVLRSTLQNCGSRAFSTPHYSHNFLNVDRRPIGPPWKVVLAPNVSSKTEPGLGDFASPMDDYFLVEAADALEAKAAVPEGVKIKALFVGESNDNARNEWVASYGGLEVRHTQVPSAQQLYAYNLYVEERTLSPEPFQLLGVLPGEEVRWGRVLSFTLSGPLPPAVDEVLMV